MAVFTLRRPRAAGRFAGGVLAIVLASVVGRQAPAADVTVAPTADTFVSASEPIYNYGGAGAVEVSAPGRVNGEYQGLLRFNLAATKAGFDTLFGAGGWKLDSAALRLTANSPNNPIFNANAAGPVAVSWMQNDAWVEGSGGPTSAATEGLTFNTLPTYLSAADESAGTIQFPGGNSGTGSYALTLSPGLAGDVIAGGDLSLRLYAGNGAASSFLFSSRSFSGVASRPALVLSASAVPEPAAGVALASVVGLLLRRRRR